MTPYGRLDPPAVAVTGQSLDEPRALVDLVAAQFGTNDRMVAASVAFQMVTSRLAVPAALAHQRLGRRIAMPFSAVRWRVAGGQVRLGLGELHVSGAGSWPELVDRLVADAFHPWVDAMRRHTRIAERLLWGDAAASLLSAVVAVAGPARRSAAESASMADVALRRLPFRHLAVVEFAGDGVAYRRRTCCLIYKAPGFGLCGECSLRSPPTRTI